MTQPNQDQKALLWQLQQKRKQKASELKLPAYILGDNKLLKLLALAQPKNWTELKNVGGVGHARLFYWGKDILEIMKAQQQPVMLPAKE